MIVVHLIRKPLAEPTVAQNVIRFGTGGLNIGDCRLPLGGHRSGDTPGSGQLGTGRTYGKANEAINPKQAARAAAGLPARYDLAGRWPVNLVLDHLGGCRCDGVQEVQGRPDNRPEGDGGRADKGLWRFSPTAATRRGYGKETVPVWDCAPGCPVQDLGGQSGETRAGEHPAKSQGLMGYGGEPRQGWGSHERRVLDTGTAARYFKQIRR